MNNGEEIITNDKKLEPCEYKNKHGGHIFEITDDKLKDAVERSRDNTNPDSGNGLITKIWGSPAWDTFHSIQFGYPLKPSQEQMTEYKSFFNLFGKVLPCSFCRISYAEFISETGDVPLTDDVMKSRETLTRWGYDLHNRINKKLGVNYGDTYEEVCYKFESFRAKCTKTGKGCVMPLNLKSKSYQNADIKRAPIIDPSYSKKLIPHAKTLGLNNYEVILKKSILTKRNSEQWMIRDILCQKIFKYMRTNGVSALDEDGLPSVYEMILFSLLSSSLEEEKLDEIIKLVC
jgi:hypothetical protein